MRKLGLVIFASLFCSSSFAASPDQNLLSQGWKKIENGVYQKVDIDGVQTTLAFGPAGAQRDFDRLSARYETLTRQAGVDTAAKNESEEASELLTALAGIPRNSGGGVQPMAAEWGQLCNGSYRYGLDSHFVVGTIGATAVARAAIGAPAFGPHPVPTAVAQYENAKVTPKSGFGSVANSTVSNSSFTALNPAVANWLLPDFANSVGVDSTKCTGSTYAYVSVTDAGCPGGSAFVSMTKSYPSCVSSP